MSKNKGDSSIFDDTWFVITLDVCTAHIIVPEKCFSIFNDIENVLVRVLLTYYFSVQINDIKYIRRCFMIMSLCYGI